MHSRVLLTVVAVLATAGCTDRAAPSNATVRAVALESDDQTELVVSGEGFAPGSEIEIKLRHFPGRVGDITRGATADASGDFVFREHFKRVAIPEEELQNNIIIAAFDSQGVAATTAKPVAQFATSGPATEAQ
jgi:hypothetical protein